MTSPSILSLQLLPRTYMVTHPRSPCGSQRPLACTTPWAASMCVPESPPSGARTRRWGLDAASWMGWVIPGCAGKQAEGQEEKMLFETGWEKPKGNRNNDEGKDFPYSASAVCQAQNLIKPSKQLKEEDHQTHMGNAEREIRMAGPTCSGSHS